MFTAEVSEELAHTAPGDLPEQIAEVAAMVRIGGTLELRGGSSEDRLAVIVSTGIGAVARRLHTGMRRLGSAPPDIEVHTPQGIHRNTRYRVRLHDAAGLLTLTGVINADGHLQAVGEPELTATAPAVSAYLRGALMAGGSFSDPRRAAHLEIRAGGEPSAVHLEGILRRAGAPSAVASPHRDHWRVVVKSGTQIGALLANTGAHQAYLRWDEGRLRRELRAAANRAVNADGANVARSVAASAQQIEAVHRVLGHVGLDDLPEDLAAVALARLANPEATMAQLGALLDPPVPKGTVHRRMNRLLAMDK